MLAKIINLKILSLFLISFSWSLYAGVTDLEVSTDLNFTQVRFLQQGSFSVTLTNNGPDVAGDPLFDIPNVVFSSYLIVGANGYLDISFILDSSIEQNCFIGLISGSPRPGGVGAFAYFIVFPVIPAGESATCYGIYGIGFEQGDRTFSWSARINLVDTDPNLDNNIVEFGFGISPPMIPVMNHLSLFILFVFMLIVAKFTFRRMEY